VEKGNGGLEAVDEVFGEHGALELLLEGAFGEVLRGRGDFAGAVDGHCHFGEPLSRC
jgi:hypothetical protein